MNTKDNVYWKSNKKFKRNTQHAPEHHNLKVLKASTLMRDLPEGLIVMQKYNEIIFRYENQHHMYQIGIAQTADKDGNHSIYQYIGRLPSLNHYSWFNRAVEQLFPMAQQLYS